MGAAKKLIGRTVAGRFRITGFIGEGAMAEVYRGEQDEEPREVAIKIMHAQLLGDPTFTARFRREAKAAALLKHPNTVQIIDYGVDGHLPYIVMEMLTGTDLFDLLVRERRMSQARAARILINICDALAVAHEQGIVHRDLKPENVMVFHDPKDPSNERIKVLDFGIAKILEVGNREDGPISLGTSSLTTVGMVVGTPAYMSPEQCKGEEIDGRSDIYACGILLFLLVTGRLPFEPTAMPWEVAMDHLRKRPPAPSSFLPQIHPALEAIILTALAKTPAQRQQSAGELRDELIKLLPELQENVVAAGAAHVPPDTPTLEAEPMPPSLRSRSTMSAISVRNEADQASPDADPQAILEKAFLSITQDRPLPQNHPLPPSLHPVSGAKLHELPQRSPDMDSGVTPVSRVVSPTTTIDPNATTLPIVSAPNLPTPAPPPASSEDSFEIMPINMVTEKFPEFASAQPAWAASMQKAENTGQSGYPTSSYTSQPAPARVRRRQPKAFELMLGKLAVPLAILLGLAVGLLAFLMMR